jgi:phosphoesterase RecJ-like protein
MNSAGGHTVTVKEVAERLRREKRILIVTHEAPDGDAFGSLTALSLVARRLGICVDAYIPGDTAPPPKYAFLPGLESVRRGAPPVVEAETTVYLLDCASLSRSHGDHFGEGAFRINIDHHQDNPGYGELNLIVPDAPSTSAILYDIFCAGGWPIDEVVATALYVGLVTDTGRFQYSNTTSAAHRMAADLIEAGVDVNEVSRRVYETTPLSSLRLLERALRHIELYLDGELVMSWVDGSDFAETGAKEDHTEGIVDDLRRIQGARVVAFIRQCGGDASGECKVSLRSTDGTINVAAIAKKQGGGGHVRASGFHFTGTPRETMDWIEAEVRDLLGVAAGENGG